MVRLFAPVWARCLSFQAMMTRGMLSEIQDRKCQTPAPRRADKSPNKIEQDIDKGMPHTRRKLLLRAIGCFILKNP